MTIEQFSRAIEAAGMVPPDVIHADGSLHRFSPSGRSSDTAGWYVVHSDGIPAGVFGCWRSGLMQTWCAKADNAMTPAEREAMRQRVRQAKAQRDEEHQQRQHMAQGAAHARWATALARPADVARHPYLIAKGVQGFGIRVEGDPSAGLLLVPMRDAAGMLHSLQSITPSGNKRFLAGGRVHGCYHAIGQISTALVIAEGFATAASIHEATGLAVAAAFNASNVPTVARALRQKYPALPLVLAADDDYATEGNPGLTVARHAALAVAGGVAVPQFPARRSGATDFNDLHQLAGLDAVRACFAEVLEGLCHEKQ
ncbi:toprim domain-containing protein [Comamonas sp. J-3]|uniref:toprim domain-containing protein n=1 Tax=Comamonas trifloxystrobinivorans TaxID=3350256 RepID=UPI003726CA05